MYKIGIDLGGTKTEGILLDDSLNTVERKRLSTPKDNYEEIIADTLHKIVFGNRAWEMNSIAYAQLQREESER